MALRPLYPKEETPPKDLRPYRKGNLVPLNSDEGQAARQRTMGKIGAVDSYVKATVAMGKRPDADAVPFAQANMASPAELPTGDDLNRLPQFDHPDEIEAERTRIGGSYTTPGGVIGSNVVLMDATGKKAVGQLNPKASFDYSKVPGIQAMPYLSGTGDPLQQGVVNVVENLSQGRIPKAELRTGRGFREALGDAGKRKGDAADLSAAQLWSYPTQAAKGLGVAMDLASEGAYATALAVADPKKKGEGPAWLHRWRAENQKEMDDGMRDVKDIEDTREYISNIKDANQLDEVESLAGEAIGKEAGEWVSLASPTTGTRVAAPVIGAGIRAMPETVKDAARKGAGRLGEYVGPLISRQPAKFGARPEERDALEAGARIFRNSADTHGAALSEDAVTGFNTVLARHGVAEDSPQAKLLMEQASRAMKSGVKGRQEADPIVAEIIDAWGPIQRKPYQHLEGGRAIERLKNLDNEKEFLDATRGAENPLHRSIGQDISKKARKDETREAREQLLLGKDAPVMKEYTPDEVANLPGIRATAHAPGIPRNELDQMKLVDHGDIQEYAEKRYQSVLASSGRLDAEAARDKILKMPFPQAIGEMHANVMNVTGKPVQEAAGYFAGYVKNAAQADKRFRHVSEVPEFGMPRANRRGTYAQKTDELVMTKQAELMLRETDSVVLRAGGREGGSSLTHGLEVHLPPGSEALDGWVVPRYVGRGFAEAVTDNAASARRLAKGLDNAIGLAQIKRGITSGNMGFQHRNLIGSLGSHVFSEGDVLANKSLRKGLDRETRTRVAQILNAPLNGTSAESQLRRRLLNEASIGKNVGHEAGKMSQAGSRAGRMLEKPFKGYVGQGISKVSDALAKPGEAFNAAADALWAKNLFPGLKGHTAEDGIRAWNVLSRMNRGVSFERAARDMNELFVDYGSKSMLDEGMGVLVPFWKFYANSLQGALKLAAENPSSLRRLHDFKNMIEGQDTADKGGALNPRFKSAADHWMMAPMYEDSGQIKVARPEVPWSTATNILGSLPEEISPIGGQEQGAGRMISQAFTAPYTWATGDDAVTKRSALNLTKKRQADANDRGTDLPVGGLARQFAQTASQNPEMLGRSPSLTGLYNINRYAPLLPGRMGTPQTDVVARTMLGIGGSPASRSEQGEASMLQRALMSILGVRTGVVDPAREMRQYATQAARKIPDHEMLIQKEEILKNKRAPIPNFTPKEYP